MLVRKTSDSLQPSHAGGVAYRLMQGAAHYLLISPKNNDGEWVLPKGHIEVGESDVQAALREVKEEAGVVAQLICPLERVQFNAGGTMIEVCFYLMKWISDTEPKEKRSRGWFSFEDAIKKATHAETRHLLRASERARAGVVDEAR